MKTNWNKLLIVSVCSYLIGLQSSGMIVNAAEPADTKRNNPLTPQLESRVLQAQAQRASAMAQASKATVAVFGLDGGGGGSGVLFTPDGYALTNFHVTSACGDHMRCGLNDGRMYDAVIVGVDATGDVSLIKLLGRDDFPTAPLGDSSLVRVGHWCFAAGNPFGLATNLQPSVSLGLVSGVGRYQYPADTLLEYSDCLQTDAAINPGNSGGPLFNLQGEVVGINGRCSFEKRGRVNVGVGYAISINQIKHFLGMLRSGRLVDHATLGATVSTDDKGDVLVSNILNSSDAYRRGLRYGDQVVSFADREIHSTNDFKNVLGTLPKDWRVPLKIRRAGQVQTLLVRLSGVHTDQQLALAVAGQLPEAAPEEKKDEKQREAKKKDKAEELPKDAELIELSKKVSPDFARVKSMLEARPGYSNFYFNRLHRDYVWKRIATLGDYSKLDAVWSYSGTVAGETTPISMGVHESRAKLQLGLRKVEAVLGDELSDVIAERREKGLLVAMLAWQQLMQLGPDKIGNTTYLGTLPLYRSASTALQSAEICDVIQAAWRDTIVRFFVPPASSEIACIEVFGDPQHDPVEVFLDQYREQDGRQWPGRVRLQYGSEPMLLLNLNAVEFSSAPAQEEQP